MEKPTMKRFRERFTVEGWAAMTPSERAVEFRKWRARVRGRKRALTFKKDREALSQHPAYAYGYRAGLEKGRRESERIQVALNEQVTFWRARYDALRLPTTLDVLPSSEQLTAIEAAASAAGCCDEAQKVPS